MRNILTMVLVVCLVGCGPARSVAAELTLSSSAIAADGTIDARQSAYGANLSPPLAWTSVDGARTYAIILEDSDAPGPHPFVHWLIWNIPASVTALPQGLPTVDTLEAPVGAVQGTNDADGVGYYGPHPPSGVHHYHFKIFALDERLPLAAAAHRGDLARAMNGHVLGIGQLTGTFAAPAGH